jgi:glutamate--cysteine ligase
VAGLRLAQARVAGTEETPSARILRELQAGDSSFYRFAMDRSTANARAIRDLGPPAKLEDARTLARQSLEDQARVEAEDDVDFETYRLRYLASARPNTQGA